MSLDDTDEPLNCGSPEASSTPGCGSPETSSTPVPVRDDSDKSDPTSSSPLNDLKRRYQRFFSEFADGCDPKSSHLENENNDCLSRMSPHSVGTFVKVADPEGLRNHDEESSGNNAVKVAATDPRAMADDVDYWNLKEKPSRELVFDLDQLVNNNHSDVHERPKPFGTLRFESRFESGNLQTAYRIGGDKSRHYELVLSPDTGTRNPHYQWFYFEVSNNEGFEEYTFDIINCFKTSSMFSRGMQPVMFSRNRFFEYGIGWTRTGSSICYFRNGYPCENATTVSTRKTNIGEENETPKKGRVAKRKHHYTLRFRMTFDKEDDCIYIAYHYPFTYSSLRGTLQEVLRRSTEKKEYYIRYDILATTLGGNAVPLVTITASGSMEEVAKREVVFITARVHPGESNSSWMMKGVLQYLSDDNTNWGADDLRNTFVFKIVPMLNPDGVINGNHRCSLAGRDLNRVWKSPSEAQFPTIYSTKALVQYSVDVLQKTPFVFVDLHGHSREMNVFMYGNNPRTSKKRADRLRMKDVEAANSFTALPERLNKIAPGFRLQQCKYKVSEKKAGSARISLWRDFSIPRCYTMESTYFGFTSSDKAFITQITCNELEQMGEYLCKAINEIKIKDKSEILNKSELIGEDATFGSIRINEIKEKSDKLNKRELIGEDATFGSISGTTKMPSL